MTRKNFHEQDILDLLEDGNISGIGNIDDNDEEIFPININVHLCLLSDRNCFSFIQKNKYLKLIKSFYKCNLLFYRC